VKYRYQLPSQFCFVLVANVMALTEMTQTVLKTSTQIDTTGFDPTGFNFSLFLFVFCVCGWFFFLGGGILFVC